MSEELKKWFGLRPADLLIYLAGGAVVGMYFVRGLVVDIVLAASALAFCVAACSVGMKWDFRITALSNWMKRLSYPACVLLALFFLYLNFTRWNDI